MKKSILFLVLLISFFLIPSIVHALSLKNIIPLDIISNLINNILGTTSTTTLSAGTSLRIHQYTFFTYDITAQQFTTYADMFQMHYDAVTESDYPTSIESIHALRPSYTGLLYRNIHKIYSDAPEVSTFQSNGWILKYPNRSYVHSNYGGGDGGLIVDIGNPNYQQWLANWLLDQINTHGWNGVFGDDGFGGYVGEVWWDVDSPHSIINPRTGNPWTDQEVRDALVGVYQKMRTTLGSNRIIAANGIFNADRWVNRSNAYHDILDRININGVMGEAWWRSFDDPTTWYSEGFWKSTLDATVDIDTNFIGSSTSRIFIPVCYIDGDGTTLSLPSGASYSQVARFAFASTLLGVSSNQIYLMFSSDATRLGTWYNTLFSLNVGSPQDSYSMISGTHIYQRTFSNALVLVNPTSSSYQITLSKSYKNLDGNVVSGTYNVNPHTGEILLSTSSPPVTTTTIPTITTTRSSTTIPTITTTISSSTTIPTSQYLVGYWKFDEGSGTTASDSSVYGNVGSLFNSPTWITGKIGNALSFNGVNSYVDVGSSSALNPTSAISVSAWIYTKSITTYPRIVSKETNSVSNPYALELINSTDIRFFIGDGTTETGTPDINVNFLNSWVHVVGTYDGQYIKIYINGQLKGQTALISSMHSRTTRVLIGNNPTNTRQFNGIIDEVKIWNKALNATEVLSEYGVSKCSDGTAYGFGEDWALNLNPKDTQHVLDNWNILLNKAQLWKFNTVRLAFRFPDLNRTSSTKISDLNYTTMDALLNLFNSRGIKVIADLHNYEDMLGEAGSQRWMNYWLQFARYYKDDNRIVAFEIFNEPYYDTWARTEGITNRAALARAFANLTDKIRQIDPDRMIIWADSRYFQDKNTSLLPSDAVRSNITYAFHSWIQNSSLSVVLQVSNKTEERMKWWKKQYPDAVMWLGEFGTEHNYTVEVQNAFAIDLINWTVKNNIGFNLWLYHSSHWTGDNTRYDNLLASSTYSEHTQGFSCGSLVTSACDSTCKAQSYASGICRTSNTLSAPTQFSLISNPRDTSTSDNNVFHTHNNLITMFKTLYDKYPGYASYEPIDKTYEGRDIVLFKIGNPNGGKVLWDGALHGWEDAGSEVEYLIAKWLLENGTTGKDTRAQRIVQRNLILFIPVVNMDSYERGNRDFGTCGTYGVDLNRNFVAGWVGGYQCGDVNNGIYGCTSGTGPASEPETQALKNAFNTYKPKFYLNGHYGGGPILDYYSGSGSNTTLTNSVLQRISQLDSQAGVTPYPTGAVGASGMTVGDASQYSNAWLLEVAGTDGRSCSCYSHTCQTYNDIVNTYYPKVLPILLAMTEASEIPITSTSSCQSGETSIGQDGCSSGQTCCCGFPSTFTTTTIPSGFKGNNFVCNYVQTNNLWECSLDYTNNLGEKGLVKFYFIDSVSSEVKSTGSIWTNTGSGTVGSELSCDNYHGTYNVVWRAYRSSDSSRSNPVAFSTSFNSVIC